MWGLHAAAHRLPFLPIRAGLGSDVMRVNPELRTVTSPYEDGEELVAVPALRLDAALVHLNRADRRGNGQYLGPDPYFDDLFCEAADAAYVSCERLVETAELDQGRPRRRPCWSAGMRSTGVVETPNGAHFTSCVPDYGRDEAFQQLYAATAAGREFAERFLSGGRARLPGGGPGLARGAAVTQRRRRAEFCVVACAEAWRGDGEILASPMGAVPPSAPGWPGAPSPPTCCSPTARRCSSASTATAGGLAAVPPASGDGHRRAAARDDGREPDRPLRQPEHLLHRRLGAARRASCSACAARRATP